MRSGGRPKVAHFDAFNTQVALVRGDLPKLVRKVVAPLIVIDVHARDVVIEMAEKGISSPLDFDWLAQLRYYWLDDGVSAISGEPASVVCKMINAQALYGFEYLGNGNRLVVTPLTAPECRAHAL